MRSNLQRYQKNDRGVLASPDRDFEYLLSGTVAPLGAILGDVPRFSKNRSIPCSTHKSEHDELMTPVPPINKIFIIHQSIDGCNYRELERIH